ncbi:MAG TPA: response regulator [Candidatus Limnocylindria bacterium]|nr:response regulator [Candidatus Limnocylindria bacterium]
MKRGVIAPAAAPSILVVDDDRRVVELLQIALHAHGFRVLTAGDGDEALRRAISERPDLVVLDVRLPRKSGLEVCETLRQDPEDPTVPIVLVSAAAETEARLQGLARGADDYLTKPFSPKELIARIKRLLIRAGEAREARERSRTAELELNRAREEVQRAHHDLRREQRLRELTVGFGRDLHRTLDTDDLASRLLLAAQCHLGVQAVGLLRRGRDGEALAPAAVRGAGYERIAALAVRAEGDLAAVLLGLGRPVRRDELERLPELRAELGPFVAHGFTMMAPLCGPEGLEGVLVADERPDARALSPLEVEVLTTLCEIAAAALTNARRAWAQTDSLVAALAARARVAEPADSNCARQEARTWVTDAAVVLMLPPRERALLGAGVTLGPWLCSDAGSAALAGAVADDPTGLIAELAALSQAAAGIESEPEPAPNRRRTAALLGAALRYLGARGRGASAPEANAETLAGGAFESAVAEALLRAARDGEAVAERAD